MGKSEVKRPSQKRDVCQRWKARCLFSFKKKNIHSSALIKEVIHASKPNGLNMT